MPPLNPAHVQWQKNILDSLKIGGTWMIPRTLTIGHRTGENTVKIEGGFPEERLLVAHIRAAGYTIEKDGRE